jgi:hypothetical protein
VLDSGAVLFGGLVEVDGVEAGLVDFLGLVGDGVDRGFADEVGEAADHAAGAFVQVAAEP